MLSKKLIFTSLFLVAGFAAFSIVGCNEGNSDAGAKVEIFPAGCVEEEIASTDKEITKIVRLTDSSQKVLGYRVEMQVKSRSGPFDIMVALDSKACVLDATVLKYKAKRGKQVRSEKFTQQFTGKCPSSTVELGIDIDAISKATLSSKSMTEGVKKAIILISKML
jgi:Na+-translocating ferredoxin:NAD+ oxidoreductase RnfG subunit